MLQAMRRFKKCNNKKPGSQIRKEVNLCKTFWGCYPLHYFRYDLYRRDRQFSDRELLNYIPEFFFYSLFLPFYDSKKYEILLADKIIMELFFTSLAIPQPRTICKLINNRIYISQLIQTSYKHVKEDLAEKEYRKVFVKPANGQGGYGTYVFSRSDRGQYITEAGDILNDEFLNEIGVKNDWIIQPGIEQDPEISNIYPNSVNTCRIVTESKNGNSRVACCELRIGKDGNQMDNFCQGGIAVQIDANRGKLGDYAISEQCEYFEKHPDTNFVFKGYKILNWNKVKEFTIKCAKKMPQFAYLGWDIVLTKNGPIVMETHLYFGLDGIQIVSGGLRETFRISDPQFYWKNRGKGAQRKIYVH